MALYSYIHEKSGDVIERQFPISRGPRPTIRHKGKLYKHSIAIDHNRTIATPGNWPKVTVMSGVQPDQAGSLAAFCKSHPDWRVRGVEVRPDGQVKCSDRKQFNAFVRATGRCHANASYGDVAPKNW